MINKFKKYLDFFFFAFVLVVFAGSLPVLSVQANITPNDPKYRDQWYLSSIGAAGAWDYGTGSKKIVVAVLDTGVEVAHPDLQENIWVNPNETFNGIDDDLDGYVDDVYGWDFVDNKPNPGPDLISSSTFAGLHHGTIVAGIIGAIGNNGTDGVGVNWHVSIMPLRVLDGAGVGDAQVVARAIDYAISKHVDVINMSFVGVNPSPELREAIWRANRSGIVVVAAGGNDGETIAAGDLDIKQQFPVCYDGPQGEKWGVIGVAALDQNDQKTFFSDYGWQCIDIAAPGVDIPSTLVYGTARLDINMSFGGHWSGTSLAAPIVSGAVALLKSMRNDLTPEMIYKIITESATSLKDKDLLYGDQLGAGKLNLAKAVSLLNTLYPPFPVQKLPHHDLLIYKPSKGTLTKFYDASGSLKVYSGKISKLGRQSLPKKAYLTYNRYKGILAIAQGDIDGDWEKEFITVKPGLNPVATVWSSNGIKKGEIKIQGDYRLGIGLVVN